MAKRLILVMALLFVAAFAFAAYAEVQNVKVSGDIEALGAYRNLDLRQSKLNAVAVPAALTSEPDYFLATITRLTISADLTDNVSTVVRLINERYWGQEVDTTNDASGVNSDVDLDLAYVTLKEFLYSPLTMTIGRQELHFGNDMIIGDPDTNNIVTTASVFGNGRTEADLTKRKSFDAIRATLNYDPITIDMVYSKIFEGNTNRDDDVSLLGSNVSYDLNKKVKIEGYLWDKKIGRKNTVGAATYNKERDTYVVGGRAVVEPVENMSASIEAAYQFGKWNGNDIAGSGQIGQNPGFGVPVANSKTVQLSAFAIEAFLNYDFKKVKYTPSLGFCYAFFSGEKSGWNQDGVDIPTSKKFRGWDPMFENQKFGDLHNVLFNQTNQHIVGLNGTIKPFQDVTVKGEYYAYWLDKRQQDSDMFGGFAAFTTMSRVTADQFLQTTHETFLGKELDITATYDYTEDVQFKLLGGLFFPGNVFSSENTNTAQEVIGSMKVTF